jgi:hypothetical protein
MAVRNQHSRQSRNYIIETIGGVRYYIEPDTFQPKSLVYAAKKAIVLGRVKAPIELIETGKTIGVICLGKGNYKFETV